MKLRLFQDWMSYLHLFALLSRCVFSNEICCPLICFVGSKQVRPKQVETMRVWCHWNESGLGVFCKTRCKELRTTQQSLVLAVLAARWRKPANGIERFFWLVTWKFLWQTNGTVVLYILCVSVCPILVRHFSTWWVGHHSGMNCWHLPTSARIAWCCPMWSPTAQQSVHVRKEASGSARLQLLRLSQTKPCLNFINEFMLCCSAASVCTKRFCRISYLQRWHLLFIENFARIRIILGFEMFWVCFVSMLIMLYILSRFYTALPFRTCCQMKSVSC